MMWCGSFRVLLGDAHEYQKSVYLEGGAPRSLIAADVKLLVLPDVSTTLFLWFLDIALVEEAGLPSAVVRCVYRREFEDIDSKRVMSMVLRSAAARKVLGQQRCPVGSPEAFLTVRVSTSC